MGCLGGDEVYFWTLHQILMIENISEATGQHLTHTLLTKPAGYKEAVWGVCWRLLSQKGPIVKLERLVI